MNFDELDARMRVFETSDDHYVLPGLFMVARIDGRGFTRLTKELLSFEKPFDERVHKHMIATTEHLMNCGFNILFGYTQSDEISLLFHPNEIAFSRKTRKYVSILASEAGGCFSLRLGNIASFDCRLSQLPTLENVVDYFRWRQEDAHRNALSSHCFWLLRSQGKRTKAAAHELAGLSTAAKNELLFQSGINFNELPNWQKRGSGLYRETVNHLGYNPMTETEMATTRQQLKIERNLPIRDDFAAFILNLVQNTQTQTNP